MSEKFFLFDCSHWVVELIWRVTTKQLLHQVCEVLYLYIYLSDTNSYVWLF